LSQRILCVCFGNSCRSPMMQALLQVALLGVGSDAVVESAGIAEKDPTPASDNAKAVMAERGLDLSGHRSRQVKDLDLGSYSAFYVVDDKIGGHLLDLGVPAEKISIINAGAGGVPNPWEKGIDAYRKCADVLAQEAQSIAFTLTMPTHG
jgi:protein-tyrosine-phosphatase